MKTTAIAATLLVLFLRPSYAQEAQLPFGMPTPEGWRTETIPFPLSFAPDLPYSGLEELRFSPGMFDAESPQYWSYAFVWWTSLDAPIDAEALATHIPSYFRGLSNAVAGSEKFPKGDAAFLANFETMEDGSFTGVAHTIDEFVTKEAVVLNIRGSSWVCEEQERLVVFFALSPQDTGHEVWTEMDSIREGFLCENPAEPSLNEASTD